MKLKFRVLAAVVAMLNVFDAVSTLLMNRVCPGVEGNSIMESILNSSEVLFMAVKVALSLVLMVVCCSDSKWAPWLTKGFACVFGSLAVYHVALWML